MHEQVAGVLHLRAHPAAVALEHTSKLLHEDMHRAENELVREEADRAFLHAYAIRRRYHEARPALGNNNKKA